LFISAESNHGQQGTLNLRSQAVLSEASKVCSSISSSYQQNNAKQLAQYANKISATVLEVKLKREAVYSAIIYSQKTKKQIFKHTIVLSVACGSNHVRTLGL
jgi:hypothetical protein